MMNSWQCVYCGTVNVENDLECGAGRWNGCGAPRPEKPRSCRSRIGELPRTTGHYQDNMAIGGELPRWEKAELGWTMVSTVTSGSNNVFIGLCQQG